MGNTGLDMATPYQKAAWTTPIIVHAARYALS
jgi:hypothetical protein